MRLSKIIDYYGSKYKIAHLYGDVKESSIVEPFAGGAGFSLLHYNKNITLYDLDERVVQVWDYVINASYDELNTLPLFKNEESICQLKCCEEAKLLISCWIRFGSPFSKTPSKLMRQRMRMNRLDSWSRRRRTYIAETSKYIKHWQVYHSSYLDIDINHHKNSLWFIDPPYFNNAGTVYKFGSQQMASNDVLQWINRLESRYIVCENSNSEAWMDFKKLTENHGVSRATNKTRKSSTEVYFSNRPLISTTGEQLKLF